MDSNELAREEPQPTKSERSESIPATPAGKQTERLSHASDEGRAMSQNGARIADFEERPSAPAR